MNMKPYKTLLCEVKILDQNRHEIKFDWNRYGIEGKLKAVESFLWDGLALISRNKTAYINEPYATGGNPVLADNKVLFNDILGTTLGVKSDKYNAITRDAFGMTEQNGADDFFTGKPYIGELGYAFLFRNYRAEKGKWQTQDPIGYPDGWNNFAYVNNAVISTIDWLGCKEWILTSVTDGRDAYTETFPWVPGGTETKTENGTLYNIQIYTKKLYTYDYSRTKTTMQTDTMRVVEEYYAIYLVTYTKKIYTEAGLTAPPVAKTEYGETSRARISSATRTLTYKLE